MSSDKTVFEDEILELFQLNSDDVKDFDISFENNEALIDIELTHRKKECPRCHHTRIVNKETIVKSINHAMLSDRKCTLRYHAHRYRCLSCNRTFYEDNPFVYKKQKISVLTVQNILNDLKNPAETFSAIAKRYHLSPTSVASIFDQHVMMERLPLSEYLCIDEVYAFKSEHSKYVCMIVDFLSGGPIDVLPSRKKEDLIDYFSRIPLKERKNVKIVGMDMWDTYRSVARMMFPECLCAADHYHVIQELNRKADRVRIRIMKNQESSSEQYYLLKHFNWIIFKNQDEKDKDGTLLFDPSRKGKFNYKFQKQLNYFEIREMIKEIDPQLEEIISLKDECHCFYRDSSYDEAPKQIKKLIASFRNSEVSEMKEFANTLSKWKQEIINSFIIIDHRYSVDHTDGHVESVNIRVNSSIIERQNASVKVIKKVTMGMGNWERFRNRVLYAIRKDSHSYLLPLDEPKARKYYQKNTENKQKKKE